MAMSVVRYRFTVEDYHRMAEAGILGEDDRVELIAGEIVEMSPVGPVHVACVALLNTLLAAQVGPDVLISVQSPIRLPDNTEPQPDLALLRRRDYRAALPGPADVLLVIEVADTSRDFDRTIKLPRYAAAGIPESWLLDLVARRLERHSDPGPDGYRQITLAWPGDTLASTVLPDIVLDVAVALGDR
jgi:Uma2 family endonuclease